MTSVSAPWLTYIALANQLRTGGAVIGRDILGLPFVDHRSDAKFRAAKPFRHLVLANGGGRHVQNSHVFDDGMIVDRPSILLTDGLSPTEINDTIGRLGDGPDGVIHHSVEHPLPGYNPEPNLPGLFLKPGSDDLRQALLSVVRLLDQSDADDIDLLEDACNRTPLLSQVRMDFGGDPMVDFTSLPLVRRFDREHGQGLLLHGVASVNRWRPVVFRVPVFGIPSPVVQIHFNGNPSLEALKCWSLDRVGVAVLATDQKRDQSSMTLKLSTDPRSLIDLAISGHGATIASISVRLSAMRARSDEDQIDPLDQFGDPLERYG